MSYLTVLSRCGAPRGIKVGAAELLRRAPRYPEKTTV
jgi:hypothetical protein